MEKFSINADYPQNLVDAVIEKKPKREEGYTVAPPKDLLPAVEYVMATLDEREYDVLRYRYLYGMNKTETARTINLSLERIRQIEAKGLRKLAHKSRFRFIQLGIQGVINSEIEETKRKYDETIKGMAKAPEAIEKERENLEKYHGIRDTTLEEMDVSVRAFNALKRAGLDTVGQIVDAFATGRIHIVRNLGNRTMEEVKNKLLELGFFEDELEYSKEAEDAYNREQEILYRIRQQEKAEQEAAEAEKKKTLLGFVKEINQTVIDSGEQVLEKLFTGSVLDCMKKLMEGFLPNERVVLMMVKTELYDAAEKTSPYKTLLNRRGRETLLREARAELSNAGHEDFLYTRYMFREVEEDFSGDVSEEV